MSTQQQLQQQQQQGQLFIQSIVFYPHQVLIYFVHYLFQQIILVIQHPVKLSLLMII